MNALTKSLFASAALAAAFALAGCGQPRAGTVSEEPPAAVELVPVAYSDAAVPIRATGVLSRQTEAELAFKIGGIVETVLVRAGDRVTKGQVLAQLRLDEIDAQLAQARSAREKAERDLGRIARLQANAVATLENLQDARTALEVAAAQVRIAEFNRRFAVIEAPADGRILRRTAEPNELVAAGRPVLGFAADGEGWLVRAGLADSEVAAVRVGDRAEVSVNGAKLAARIAHIAEAAEALTRTTPLEIVLEAAPAEARSGLVVEVRLFPRAVAERAKVPASALIEGEGERASVLVVEAGASVAKRVVVEVEQVDGADAYLRTPLPRTAQIVAKGGEYLHDGAKVSARK